MGRHDAPSVSEVYQCAASSGGSLHNFCTPDGETHRNLGVRDAKRKRDVKMEEEEAGEKNAGSCEEDLISYRSRIFLIPVCG